MCLGRSLLLYRYLSSVGASPTLLVGVQRTSGTVSGHAWVEIEGGRIEEKSAEIDGLVQVMAFGAEGLMIRRSRTTPARPDFSRTIL